MNDRIFIIAGEVSGDGFAAELMSSIKQTTDVSFYGYGGVKMREQGLITTTEDNSMFSAIDYFSFVRNLHKQLKISNDIIKDIKKTNCKHIVLVDRETHNIIVAKKIRKAFGNTVKIYFYIAPRVSMWKKRNALIVANLCDAIFCYAPSDLPMYQEYTKNSFYFGSPLAKKLKTFVEDDGFFDRHNLDKNLQYMALLPGSRTHEIHKLLPIFLQTASRLNQEKNIHFLINYAHQGLKDSIYKIIVQEKMLHCVHLVNDSSLNIMKHCTLGLVSVGTTTLESVMMGMYPIITYKLSDITYYIGKKLEGLGDDTLVGLPNIFLQQRFFPEILQFEVTSERLYQESIYFLDMNPEMRKHIMTNATTRLSDFLGSINSVDQVANYIINDMKD